MMNRVAIFSLPWIMAGVFAGPPLTENQRLRTAAAFDLVAGAVVDPTSGSIYIMGANGGVEALSTVTGDLLWRSASAAKPVGIYGDWVVAQVETTDNLLDLVRLDTVEGTLVDQGIKIPLANGIYTHINDGLGRRFSARSHFISDSFFIGWAYHARVIQGIPPRDGAGPVNTFSGALLIDFEQNQASATSSGGIPLDPSELLPQTVTDWLAANRPSIGPIRVGDLFAATYLAGAFPQTRAVLKRWQADTGQELPDVVLHDKRQILQFASSDTRHVLITTRTAPGASGEYKWELFSLESGEAEGSILDHFSLGEFFLAENLIIVVTPPFSRVENGQMVEYPLSLRAIQLNTSELIWDHRLRNTQFRGPFPP